MQTIASERELKRIFNCTTRIAQVYNPVREIVPDEPDITICRGCGEEECICEPETKLRIEMSQIFDTLGFKFMTKDVLECTENKLRPYLDIAAFFSQSEKLDHLARKINLHSHEYKCIDCGNFCIPSYWTNGRPLCERCARESFGH